MRRRVGIGATAALLAIAIGGALPSYASAATWTVNTTSDAPPNSGSECQGAAGDCSLRQAIDKAAAGDTVALPASVTPYAVTLGQIALSKILTLSGAGAGTTKIEGNASSGIFAAAGLAGGTLTIAGVAIDGGSTSGSGGGLALNSSDTTFQLTGVVMSDDTATVAGGAIELASGTTLHVSASTLGPGNVATGSGGTGGVGGAIDNNGGALTITDSTVAGNSATGGGTGGGISTENSGTTALHYATVAFNTASGTGAVGGNLYSNNPGNDPAGFTATDTIVADGGAPSGGDCNSNVTVNGGFLSTGHNLTDGVASTGTASCGFTQSTDVLGDARLGPLEHNGGPTDTEALAAGSPAIDQIPSSDANCTGADQRGVSRPQGSGCEIGALEAGGGETAPQWSPAHDFLAFPKQANPSPDSLGNSGVWSYEKSASLASPRDPSTYTLLSAFAVQPSCNGLQDWADPSGFPDVDFNTGSATQTCFSTVTLPGRTLLVHPAPSDYGIVAWKSPVTGTIDVAGSFVSTDPNGGSGTTWYVDKNSTNLASAVNPVGGAGDFELAVTVSAGDTLYFLLGPSNGDYTYDTTELNLTITGPPQPPPPSADLALAASAAPSSVNLGQPVTDTFTVTNGGPSQADGVTVSDPLPSGVTLQSASASQGTCSGTTTVSCALGSIANGAQATVTVTLVPTAAGVVSNSATVSASTADPNAANNGATATASAACTTSMTVDQVQVLADCITPRGDGTFLASGHARFSDGASVVLAGTQNPAALVLDPTAHTITLAPASGGGAQSGQLEADGVDVATGQLDVHTQGAQDPISGVAGSAAVTGISSVDLALSGWTFSDVGVTPTVYLVPSAAGGGAIVDGQLTLPGYFGSVLAFGSLTTNFGSSVTGELAVQAAANGTLSVHNGGISIKDLTIGYTSFTIKQAQIDYSQAGDQWTGSGTFESPYFGNLVVNPVVIGQGKLDDFVAHYEAGGCTKCGIGSDPQIGTILDVKDVDLQMLNLQGIPYVPPGRFPLPCGRFFKCPPAPQIDGEIVVAALGDRIIGGGKFQYLLSGAFTASGQVGMAPLYGGKLPIPTSTHGLENTLASAKYGIDLASGQLSFTPPHRLTVSGQFLLPPPPIVQFLKGSFSIGIDPPHFTGEGSLDLIVPPGAPILGGDDLGGVAALISDKAAAASASVSVCAPSWLGGGCLSQSVVIAFVFRSGSFQFNLNGNINDYATVSQAASAAAGANQRVVRVPGGRQFASFTIRSARGAPNVALISPAFHAHRMRLTLATSRRRGNHSGGLAAVNRTAHEESFLVALPLGGRWTVRRLTGPKIASVRVTVRRKTRAVAPAHLVPRAHDLPKGTLSSTGTLRLHYSVPRPGAGTTVDLWAGTQDHGAGGVMIAQGLSPSGAASWKLSGLPSGRYWPYAIINRNGIPVAITYWPGSVEVADPSAPPAPGAISATVSSGQTLVNWNMVSAATTYALTADPVGGGAPVRDAVPAAQLGDELTLGKGSWSITVRAVDAQDRSSLPSAAASVTVR